MRRWLPAVAYDHPVTVMMACLALLVIGSIAWGRISLQLMPSGFEPPFIQVWIPYKNATPLETDEKIVQPMLAQLATLPGIKSVRSSARENGGSFRVEFHKTVELNEAYNEVNDRVERARLNMPEEVDRAYLYKFAMDDQPILFMGMGIPEEVDDPYYLLERVLKSRFERIKGVASVNFWGVPKRSVYVDYDRDKIVSHGIDVGALQGELGSDNFQMSAGQLESGEQIRHVRSLARFEDVDTLKRYPVRDQIVLESIADVRFRDALSSSFNRLNGQGAAVVAIQKESGANTIDVTRLVREETKRMEQDPRNMGLEFFPFFDQGEMVKQSIDNLVQTALIGGFFSVVVLFAFLREWRMTLLIALSIPFSVLITIGALYFRGDSLNLLSLMGLMLAVGMVVDNAIVVVETIYRRRAGGAGLRESAVKGSAEVNLAIVMSTATTMVVFLPLILMSDDTNTAFFAGVLGLPVVFALVASLFVALFFAPVATRFIGRGQVKEDPVWLRWMVRKYKVVLHWSLAHRYNASFTMVVLFFLTVLVPVQQVRCTAVDEGEQNNFEIDVSVHPQAGPSERDRILSRVENVLNDHKEEWGVKVYYAELDSTSSWGKVEVWLENDGPMTRKEVMDSLEPLLPNDEPGVSYFMGWGAGSGGGGNRISFQIFGENMDVLNELGDETVRRLKDVPGVLGARRDVLNDGTEELHVLLNREALNQYGLTGQTVGGTLAFYMRGTELNPIQNGDRETSILTQFELEDRGDLNAVLNSPVFSPATMGLVPVRSLGSIGFQKSPWQIRRVNGITSIEVSVDLDEEVEEGERMMRIREALNPMVFPRGYSWDASEWERRESEDWSSQLMLLGMSIIFVYLLMGILFESWLLPVSVITTVPMAGVGAFWLLWVTDTAFDSMAAIGLVVLVGVVVNNGIVLIDLIRQLREEGMSRREAILQAGQSRFRPIMMTALTTIFGLVPMALGSGEFVGISYAPLGRTVIGGLIAATVLTLVFVPFLYACLDDLRRLFFQIVRFWFPLGAK